jgi:thiol-disulfide isomerase/thioredoxin/uncharacterized membrane protein YphA (DoxX/SURF4 family)
MIAMDSFAIAAELLLAAVFAVAGVAKLLDLQGSQKAVAEFGLPEAAAPAIGFLLPVAELVTAVLLVLHPTATVGAALALALLVAFMAGISNAMVRGRAPDCNCFGQLHSAPAGRRTLARNSALGAIAVALLINGRGPAVDAWVADRSAAELVAIVAIIAAIALAFTALWLWSQNRKLDAHLAVAHSHNASPESVVDWDIEGLAAGVAAPAFTLPDARGELHTLPSLLAAGKPLMLFFMEPGCGPCKGLMPELARWQEMVGDRVAFTVLSTSSAEHSAATYEEHSIDSVLFDESRTVFRAFHLQGTPKAILVDPNGTIAGGPAGGMHMPEVLLRVALRRAQSGDWSQPAPSDAPGLVVIEPQAV